VERRDVRDGPIGECPSACTSKLSKTSKAGRKFCRFQRPGRSNPGKMVEAVALGSIKKRVAGEEGGSVRACRVL